MDDAALAGLRTVASALVDIGFATMIGALATLTMLRGAPSDWAAQRTQRCRQLLAFAALATLAASLAWMEVQAIAMTDLPPAAALVAVGGIVVDTQLGHAWILATLALAACVALAAAFPSRPAPLRTLALAAVVVAAAHASAGHAGANGPGWPLLVATAHVLATGLWAGGVFAAALGVLRGAAHAADGVRYVARLSMLASAALAGVVLTGVAAAWHGLGGSPAALAPATATPWGVVLDAKLALVTLAVALGACNRFFTLPALLATSAAPPAWQRFARILRVEAAVLLATLVAAAWLANGEPPAL
jgi:putative copper resistance protein D